MPVPAKKRKKFKVLLNDEELELSHSHNMEEKEQKEIIQSNNVKSLQVICLELLESMSRSNRVFVKNSIPIHMRYLLLNIKAKVQ